MRRPDADLEEKREPRVTIGRRNAEVIRVRLDIGRDREAGAQPWPPERVLMPRSRHLPPNNLGRHPRTQTWTAADFEIRIINLYLFRDSAPVAGLDFP